MFTLQAEPRSTGLKAKRLRQKGLIPVCLYGGDMEASLLLQITRSEAKKLLKAKTTGGRVVLDVGGEKADALLREIGRNPASGGLEHLSFQKLSGDELVTSAAKIVLVNREKIPVYIQQVLFEIPYRALASRLVEKVAVDLDGMRAGGRIKVKDLDIARNDEIELLTQPDGLVLSLVENKRQSYMAPQ